MYVCGGVEPHLVNDVVLCGLFSTGLEQLREPWKRAETRGVARPWGQGSGSLVLAFAWPLACSMALGLAFLYMGLSFLTCHGSRLDCLGEHQ